MSRKELLLSGIDKNAPGVEVAPFYNPIAPKREGWNVFIIDVFSTDELRQIAHTHSEESVRNHEQTIEVVDGKWDGQMSFCELCGFEQKAFVIASHVVEHQPDLVNFLRDCSGLIQADGVVSLAVPDMRKCFDLLKMPSTTASVLAAHEQKRKVHSPETLWEANAYSCTKDGQSGWAQFGPGVITFNGSLISANREYLTEKVRPSYVDAHAWHFTPASFELIILELNLLGFIDLVVHSLVPIDGSEFIAQLKHGTLDISAQDRRARLCIRRLEELTAVLPLFAEPL